jgi:CDP-diacylglycerol--serine O-phosphatidyltransferase
MDSEPRPPQVLAPQNLVTLGNLACGVVAMLLCVTAVLENNPHRLYEGGLYLVLANLLDAVDGKLARITGSASPLGAQLDSLADAVTFGVAPGILSISLLRVMGPGLDIDMHPRLMIIAPVIFSCCAVLRLARFNVDHESEDLTKDHAHFIGLPSPGAAALPIALVLFFFGVEDTKLFTIDGEVLFALQYWSLVIIPFLLMGLGLLMVSRVPYPHFFAWMTRSRRPVKTLAKFVVLFGLLFLEPELAMVFMAGLFVFVPLIRDLPSMFRKSQVPPNSH